MTTRTPLRRDLADLKQKVYLMGEKCIEISSLYNTLIGNYSTNLEKRLTDITEEIKKDCKELNDQCFLVLTLQQPLIKDLRLVIGSLQIVLNLEKLTDQYKSTLSALPDVNLLSSSVKDQLIKMASIVQELLTISLTLYLSSNNAHSKEITKKFSEINYIHDILYKQILSEVATEGGQKAQIEAQLLAAVRSQEKISDLIQSIVEQINFIISGSN